MKIVEIGFRKNMLKLDDGIKSSWYKIPESYLEGLELTKTLAVDDDVEVKYTVINGASVVNQLTKTGSSPAPVVEEKPMEETKVQAEQIKIPDSNEVEIGKVNNFDKAATALMKEDGAIFKCGKCGKAMANDKYENCYTCNQEEWKAGNKGNDRNSSIERQAIGKMTATTIAKLAPNTSVEGLLDLIDQVYDKYKQKVTE